MPWITHVQTSSNVLTDADVAKAARQIGEKLVGDSAEADLFAIIVANARRDIAKRGAGSGYEVYLANDGSDIRPSADSKPTDGNVELTIVKVLNDADTETVRVDALTAEAEAALAEAVADSKG